MKTLLKEFWNAFVEGCLDAWKFYFHPIKNIKRLFKN